MHSTKSFSMNGKEGRGDTSVWTDTPLDRAQKAQQRYAYCFFPRITQESSVSFHY